MFFFLCFSGLFLCMDAIMHGKKKKWYIPHLLHEPEQRAGHAPGGVLLEVDVLDTLLKCASATHDFFAVLFRVYAQGLRPWLFLILSSR